MLSFEDEKSCLKYLINGKYTLTPEMDKINTKDSLVSIAAAAEAESTN